MPKNPTLDREGPTGNKNPKYKGTGEMPGDAGNMPGNARQINEPGPVRDQP